MSATPLPSVPVVAVFNTSPDTVAMLRYHLESGGFIVVGVMTYELRDGEIDLEHLVHQHRPSVVIYDIAPPYDQNVRLLRHFQSRPALQACEFVLTSTNSARVSSLVSSDEPVFEIIGKPYDLNEILRAVQEAHKRAAARAGNVDLPNVQAPVPRRDGEGLSH